MNLALVRQLGISNLRHQITRNRKVSNTPFLHR